MSKQTPEPHERPSEGEQQLYRRLRERNERRQHEQDRRVQPPRTEHPWPRQFRHPSR